MNVCVAQEKAISHMRALLLLLLLLASRCHFHIIHLLASDSFKIFDEGRIFLQFAFERNISPQIDISTIFYSHSGVDGGSGDW